jgi:hypothetical protein
MIQANALDVPREVVHGMWGVLQVRYVKVASEVLLDGTMQRGHLFEGP